MTARVEVHSELLTWACERRGLDVGSVAERLPAFDAWMNGERHPTLRQLEQFARITNTPIGYFLLPSPPEEPVPIPDFRTMRRADVDRPSPDLLDTIYLCQQRQEWYRLFARSAGEPPLGFVGSATLGAPVRETARELREAVGFDLDARQRMATWSEALRCFIDLADHHGVLVMVSGVVGSNNRRKLDPEEFRGFALTDEWAPLVFINGADTKAAQMFTLAHELAHVWLGKSALSDVAPCRGRGADVPNETEDWCNSVAAEFLVPLSVLREELDSGGALREQMDRLARRFKVSTLVILRRMHDAGVLSRSRMWEEYRRELDRLRGLSSRGGGGEFYRTQTARTGRRFARALVVSTLGGQTLHRDALRLLGFSKTETFQKFGAHLGVVG
ncbi:MAG: ImmA/IrrE family metallo-endopeptidase [Planctomycetota bacterium]